MKETEFGTAQLAKILNRSLRFCIDWTERGLFVADVQPAAGLGSKRRFSYSSVLMAALALTLKEKFHITREFIKDLMKMTFTEGSPIQVSNLFDGTMIIYNPHYKQHSGLSFDFMPRTLDELLNSDTPEFRGQHNIEAMIAIDLSHIKALVENQVSQIRW